MKLKPAIALADMMRTIKANSSKWVNETRKPDSSFAWQDGYSAFSVSESQVEHVRRYIRNQQEQHRTAPFAVELRELLQRHGIKFDPRFLCD